MATNFYLDKRTDKNGDSAIRVSISICGVRFITTTRYKISVDKWNANKQRVKNGSQNAKGITYNVINAELSSIINYFSKYENNTAINGTEISTEKIRQEFINNFGAKSIKKDNTVFDFWYYYDRFVQEMGTSNQWSNATYRKFSNLRKQLKDFNPNITFNYLDENGLNKFVVYLREELDYRNTTIGKQLAFLKWFLKWATVRNYNKNISYQSFTPKLKGTTNKVIFLDWGELMKVYNFSIPKNNTTLVLTDNKGKTYEKIVHKAESMSIARDIFCFCCFTSLRFSDAVNLKYSNVNGNNSITITTVKTADTISIELNKYALSILEKYKNVSVNNGYVFPHITNQIMNKVLKDLAEMCEINEMITITHYKGSNRIDETLPKYELVCTHTGRRTFICNALMLGIPPQIVMKWTGHSKYESMKPYIDIADEAKAKAMDLFNKL